MRNAEGESIAGTTRKRTRNSERAGTGKDAKSAVLVWSKEVARESTGLLNRACRFPDNAEGERNFTDGTVEGSSKMGQIEGIILCTHDHSMRLSASQRIRNAHRSSPYCASRTALSRLCREWNSQFSWFV